MISSNYLIKASRKASKLLNRDFCELEKMQQSSSALISSFVEKSLERTRDILIDEISKIRNVYFSDAELYKDCAFEKKESFLMIEMIDSIYNFSRSIPAFGMILTYVDYSEEEQKHYPYSSIIDLPLMNQIFIFQDSFGGYIEDSEGSKKRVYAKRFGSLDLVLSTEGLNRGGLNFDLEILTKSTQLKIKKSPEEEVKNQNKVKKSLEFRNFGSDLYHIFLMLSIKADAVLFKKPNLAFDYTLKLIAKEVGLKLSNVNDFTVLKN